MLKRIQSRLLTHFPQLWNTRIVLFLPVALIFHILFYLAGYLKPFSLKDLHRYSYYRYEEVVLFSVLLTALLIIVWLVFYLRNNPLKAGYPLKRFHLIKEFLLLFLVFFSSATFFFTYQQGVYNHTEQATRTIDIVEETDRVNLAMHFVARDASDFRIYRSCDSLEARDKRREDRLQVYYQRRDSGILQEDDYINNEPIDESLDSLPLSYLYYCQIAFDVRDYRESDPEILHEKAQNWLLGGHRDSVLWNLQKFKALMDAYEISNNFYPSDHVANMGWENNFRVDTIYSNSSDYYDEYLQQRIPQAFMDIGEFDECMDRIEEVREGFWDWQTVMAMLYYAFSMALLLMSFRMTSIRVWFSALIGSGIVSLLITMIMVMNNVDELVIYIIFLLYLFFFIASIGFIRGREHKFASGILMLWALWLQLSILPMIWAKFESYYDRIEMPQLPGDLHQDHPMYTWFHQHWPELMGVNLLVALLLLAFVYFPLTKKWQANPEE